MIPRNFTYALACCCVVLGLLSLYLAATAAPVEVWRVLHW